MSSETNDNVVLTGSCFCRKVTYEIRALPLLSAYCHCTQCQRLNGTGMFFFLVNCGVRGPFNVKWIATACSFLHTMHFEANKFKWTQSEPDEQALDYYDNHTKPYKRRWRCRNCGSAIASYNSKKNRWSVWGATLDRDEDGGIKNWELVKPTCHQFYGTRLLDINDALSKWEGYEDQSNRLG
jgi:hypothetical protein